MDLGVGSFVFSSGLVSARALIKELHLGKTDSLLKRLSKSLRHSFALLFMGLVRLAVTKGTDYHVRETYYNILFPSAKPNRKKKPSPWRVNLTTRWRGHYFSIRPFGPGCTSSAPRSSTA